MKLEIMFNSSKFNLSNNIEITLFDVPAIKKWFDYFSKANAETNIYTMTVEQLSAWKTPLVDDCETHWNTILTSLNHLRSIGYNFDLIVPDQFDYDQQTLNRLHRFFTYNMLWVSKDPTTPNPFDLNFTLPTKNMRNIWHTLVDPINRAVHKLEQFSTPTANKSFVDTQFPIHTISFINNNQNYTNQLLSFDDNDIEQNYSFFNYNQSNLVTLDRSILGKCILQSFLEDDDPAAQDCTGRLVSWGGFNIDLNDNRKKIYKSAQFIEWAERYKLKNIPYEFPIGYVTSSSRPLQDFGKLYNRFRSVRFLGTPGGS